MQIINSDIPRPKNLKENEHDVSELKIFHEQVPLLMDQIISKVENGTQNTVCSKTKKEIIQILNNSFDAIMDNFRYKGFIVGNIRVQHFITSDGRAYLIFRDNGAGEDSTKSEGKDGRLLSKNWNYKHDRYGYYIGGNGMFELTESDASYRRVSGKNGSVVRMQIDSD